MLTVSPTLDSVYIARSCCRIAVLVPVVTVCVLQQLVLSAHLVAGLGIVHDSRIALTVILICAVLYTA